MKSEMENDILKVLITEEELQRRIGELGGALYERFQGKRPLFLGVLKGSFVFMADLVRAWQYPCLFKGLLPHQGRGFHHHCCAAG